MASLVPTADCQPPAASRSCQLPLPRRSRTTPYATPGIACGAVYPAAYLPGELVRLSSYTPPRTPRIDRASPRLTSCPLCASALRSKSARYPSESSGCNRRRSVRVCPVDLPRAVPHLGCAFPGLPECTSHIPNAGLIQKATDRIRLIRLAFKGRSNAQSTRIRLVCKFLLCFPLATNRFLRFRGSRIV